ncbi:MAG: threonine ammonia-lyase, partial [Rufibacter sp.]
GLVLTAVRTGRTGPRGRERFADTMETAGISHRNKRYSQGNSRLRIACTALEQTVLPGEQWITHCKRAAGQQQTIHGQKLKKNHHKILSFAKSLSPSMNKQDLRNTAERIKPYIHRTPVLTSRLLNEIAGAELHFKCENFQRMGAFKMRGAVNAILQLTPDQRAKGVVTHSSGNFAQALALAAQSVGVKAYIVMPENAPQVKKEAVKGYGGEIIECASTPIAREEVAAQIEKEKGAYFIHPSNDREVILGQGTAALELLEDHPELAFMFSPVGGGGLIAGTALAAHYFGQNCKVIGGEPFGADDAYRSLRSGQIETNDTTHTVADGLRTNLGDINFPIIQKYVDQIIRVEESEITAAMRLLWERLKVIVEPSSAVAFAALLRDREAFAGQKVGILLSGGNVDLKNLPF